MTDDALLGLLLGVGMAGGIVLVVAAWNGWLSERSAHSTKRTELLSRWSREVRRRAAIAAAVAAVVGLVTRWPIAVIAAGVLTWLWPAMFGGAKASAAQLERLEGVATWTESLRDTIAGSIGLEQAITHSLDAAPAIVQAPLQRLVGRLRAHVPLPLALSGFAEEFDDASVDLVAAALILNSRLRGSGLVGTLTALADSAREELEMRRKIEEGRKVLRRAAAIIVGVTAAFAGGLVLFSRTYVEPYSTPGGQVMLAIVIGVFATGFIWIKKASGAKTPERFLAGADQLAAATATVGGERR
ncbi:type II secretion system F family protein [Aeromicrobium ginsengisoli]|uniref:Type II secretion system protein n=1 Tax=Aeromicrobium ginsengisoli TaxID=363867 RepID=A0A5M4FEW1_9ACTN|nr:type II secretion system protein [Aeromicrobium ginsengisoli]KAA1397749.1 type II secretion system protein [Aeromicrobium ginsengisoli]